MLHVTTYLRISKSFGMPLLPRPASLQFGYSKSGTGERARGMLLLRRISKSFETPLLPRLSISNFDVQNRLPGRGRGQGQYIACDVIRRLLGG